MSVRGALKVDGSGSRALIIRHSKDPCLLFCMEAYSCSSSKIIQLIAGLLTENANGCIYLFIRAYIPLALAACSSKLPSRSITVLASLDASRSSVLETRR